MGSGDKSLQGQPDGAAKDPEKDLARQVADKIWADCAAGQCTTREALRKTANAELDKASHDNPGANAFLVAVDLDQEVSRRQEAIKAPAKGNTAELAKVTKSKEFTFAGWIHAVVDRRIEHLEPPPGWKPSCDCGGN